MQQQPILPLDGQTILAPMAGITDIAFRTLMRRKGSAASVTELVSADGLIRGGDKTLRLASFLKEESPVGVQLFGADADVVVQASETCQEMGCDFIDMNFGCPVPKVVKKGAGAAMTRDVDRLHAYLTRVKAGLSVPLTIKVRTGWDAESVNVLEVARVAEDVGCAWIAIHGRTRAQGYKGYADWDLIRDVAQAVAIPVIGNGDILEADEAERRLQETGCAAVMIGRGALRNPWIFGEHRALRAGEEPASGTFLELVQEHRELLLAHHTDRHALLQLKKFSMWYSFGFPGSRDFRRRVFQEDSLDEVWNVARAYFEGVAHLPASSKDRQPFLKGGHG